MWFGILTPGAHPSRPEPTDDATVLAWSPRDRRRIDGPSFAVHGGIRVVRRTFHAGGVPAAPPRCFVCRRPVPVPDPGDLRDARRLPPAFRAPDGAVADRAVFALVHAAPLRGPEDPPLDEEVVLVVPGLLRAGLLPLDALPGALLLAGRFAADVEPPTCAGCGVLLPGSREQRALLEPAGVRRAPARRPRPGHGRRAA